MAGELVRIRGTVQGVGFRPHVARVARRRGLRGFVRNDGEGVVVALGADAREVESFIQEILASLPPLARVTAVEREPAAALEAPEPFAILESADGSSRGVAPSTELTPDAATCLACVAEVREPEQRRYRYAFTNCTNCGPRFSILEGVPYDRAKTTMHAFALCVDCRREYETADDRRYHAQPIACHACGPRVRLERADGRAFSFDRWSSLDEVDATGGLLLSGELVAVKGLGGYHLMALATNETAVALLRSRKKRDAKPFALMARDLEVVRRYALVSPLEEAALASAAAPIVLLEKRDVVDPQARPLAPGIAPDTRTLGFMLPYTPLHHLILKRVGVPVVCTSGNLSDEPQVTTEEEARAKLSTIADWFLHHDRPIAQRVDDSVVRLSAGAMRSLRRARGEAPAPIALPAGFEEAPAILGCGAQLKSTVCLIEKGRAVLSQHVGDLDHLAAFEAWEKTLALLERLHDHRPRAVAVDLHPEYRSTEAGRARAQERGIPAIAVQHHHAHIAACLVENGWARTAGPVLGVAFDGLGYGTGGELWGGEFLIADYARFERFATFKPVALLGGDAAARQPWRNLYAHLMAEMGWAELSMNFTTTEVFRRLEAKPRAVLDRMLETGTGSPKASSCGRLFDAVAAAAGLAFEELSYEGQAALRLESAVDEAALAEARAGELYPLALPRLERKGLRYVEPLALWRAVLGDVFEGTRPGVIAARFHLALAEMVAQVAEKARAADSRLGTVALTGGCFQNRVLTELAREALERASFRVLLHRRVPPHDGGIALGQAAIAAAQLLEGGVSCA